MARGLTIEQAARAAGVSSWTWRQLEAGGPSRGPRDWGPFARVLGVDPDRLRQEYHEWRSSGRVEAGLKRNPRTRKARRS